MKIPSWALCALIVAPLALAAALFLPQSPQSDANHELALADIHTRMAAIEEQLSHWRANNAGPVLNASTALHADPMVRSDAAGGELETTAGNAADPGNAQLKALHQRLDALDASVATYAEKDLTDGTGRPSSVLLQGISNGRLFDMGSKFLWRTKNPDLAELVYQAALEREPLTALDEGKARLGLAFVARIRSKAPAAEAGFRKVIELAGESTSLGLEATYQLAWQRQMQGDLRGAQDTMARVANLAPEGSTTEREARFNEGAFAAQRGDRTHAEHVLQTLHDDLEGLTDESSNRIRAKIDKQLAALRGS